MKGVNRYLYQYGKAYGILLLLSLAYMVYSGIFIMVTSDTTGFTIVPFLFTALVVALFFVPNDGLNLTVGGCGLFISVWMLVGSIDAYVQLSSNDVIRKEILQFGPFCILSVIGSDVIIMSPFFSKKVRDEQSTR